MNRARSKSQSQLHRSVRCDLTTGGPNDPSGGAPCFDPQRGLLPEFQPGWQMFQKNRRRLEDDSCQFDPRAADAWHASYGTHVSRAVAQSNANEFVTQAVIGTDDRIQITNTDAYPYCAICSLEITAKTGRQFVGTGWLASNDTVITAGHCIYMPDQGGWAKRVKVFPGRNGVGGSDPFLGIGLQSVEGWTKSRKPAADYGAIQLNGKTSEHGTLGYLALKDRDLMSNLYHVAGYSADKPLGTLWGHARQLQDVRKNVLLYETDTYGGNSGGPVFFLDDQSGEVYVVGIHNYGDVSGNSATRITAQVFDTIADWIG